jgi:hypothetical protein
MLSSAPSGDGPVRVEPPQRNGYRHRDLDTRVGTIAVAIPKLRKGTYFPEWLLERRTRPESALITVVADCYLAGVSTRRMDKLVKTLGIDGLSRSQVSRMAADPDSIVEDFRHRPLGRRWPVHVRYRQGHPGFAAHRPRPWVKPLGRTTSRPKARPTRQRGPRPRRPVRTSGIRDEMTSLGHLYPLSSALPQLCIERPYLDAAPSLAGLWPAR